VTNSSNPSTHLMTAAFWVLRLSRACLLVSGHAREAVDPQRLEHLSLQGWKHSNLLGRYHFATGRHWSLSQLGLLRIRTEIVTDTRDDQDEG
jgi:hypothetical protein